MHLSYVIFSVVVVIAAVRCLCFPSVHSLHHAAILSLAAQGYIVASAYMVHNKHVVHYKLKAQLPLLYCGIYKCQQRRTASDAGLVVYSGFRERTSTGEI